MNSDSRSSFESTNALIVAFDQALKQIERNRAQPSLTPLFQGFMAANAAAFRSMYLINLIEKDRE